MTLEVEAVTPPELRVLIALLKVYERDGRATVRSVAQAAGLRGPGSTLGHLRRLRLRGLVAWEDGRTGTLRPAVRRVA